MAIQKITSGIIQDGAIAAADIVSVANTAITGNITSSQIAPDQTLNGNVSVTGTLSTPNTFGFKNRIINGGMVIDQRNAGASVTPTQGQYTLDRWQSLLLQASKFTVQQNAGAVTAPAGFINYLGVTSSSAYSVLSTDYFAQATYIEGLNATDLGWGTANAQSVTLSFWVRSSLTGTFGGSIQNYANNYSYPFTYAISSANTWTYATVTISGPTAGTWLTTNSGLLQLSFSLGVGSTYQGTAGTWASSGRVLSPSGCVSVVGTNGATFYITGVQLEKGSTATSFDFRDYGRELALCQRYYYRMNADTTSSFFSDGQCAGTTDACGTIQLKVSMRINPTALEQSGTATDYRVNHSGGSTTCSSVPTIRVGSSNAQCVTFTVASGLTLGRACALQALQTTAYLAWSAEL